MSYRQEDLVTALLFTVSLDAVIKNIEGIGPINKNSIHVVAHANDAVILSRDKKKL